MPRPLAEKLPDWILDADSGPEIQETIAKIEQLAARLYNLYEPTQGPHPNFHQRLDDWINSVPEEEKQRCLLQIVPHIFFLGPRELDSMYRVAFNTGIGRWLIDQQKVMLDDPYANEHLQRALRETWICPITDSMRINAFYHLNHIPGRDFRPDWRSLALLGDDSKIKDFIRTEKIKRLVLLEDFVGSGSQIQEAVRFAATKLGRMPVLIVPLVLCPSGLTLLERYQSIFTHLSYSSVIQLSPDHFLCDHATSSEPKVFAAVRELVKEFYHLLLDGLSRREKNLRFRQWGEGARLAGGRNGETRGIGRWSGGVLRRVAAVWSGEDSLWEQLRRLTSGDQG